MNTEQEKCLATNAHHQIDICCQTLCEKDIVKNYIKYLEEKIKELESERQQ